MKEQIKTVIQAIEEIEILIEMLESRENYSCYLHWMLKGTKFELLQEFYSLSTAKNQKTKNV